jgi:major membrane immunogen (membrane-anchored lipoprotein)
MNRKEHTMIYRTAALCALLLLGACNKNDNPIPTPKLLQEQREVLDKAKAVDGTVQQQSETQRKATEQQSQ